ncbi:MAG: hypothetical protein ACR2OX_02215, partial [Methyloligellaceae bacterium]
MSFGSFPHARLVAPRSQIFFPLGHRNESLIKARDDLTLTDDKFDWFTLSRAIEYGSVGERPRIIHTGPHHESSMSHFPAPNSAFCSIEGNIKVCLIARKLRFADQILSDFRFRLAHDKRHDVLAVRVGVCDFNIDQRMTSTLFVAGVLIVSKRLSTAVNPAFLARG